MEKLSELVNTSKRFDKFLNLLTDRIINNKPISDNSMLDGAIISMILSKKIFVKDLLLKRDMGRVLDGTISQLKQIVIWINNNETELIKIFKGK